MFRFPPWKKKDDEDNNSDDRRKGERRHAEEGVAPSLRAHIRAHRAYRISAALGQSLGWTLLWLALLPLAVAGFIGLWYVLHQSSLESVAILVSGLLSDAIYAVDVHTGWFSLELPKVMKEGFKQYVQHLPVANSRLLVLVLGVSGSIMSLLVLGVALYRKRSWRFVLTVAGVGIGLTLLGIAFARYVPIAVVALKLGSAVIVTLLVFAVATYFKRLRRWSSVLAVVALFGTLFGYYLNLDSLKEPPGYGAQLRDFHLKGATHVTDVSGKVEIGCFANENRDVIALDRVSPHLLSAILAVEDHKFADHHGFNLFAMTRAGIANAISAKIAAGASTLTMQITKNVFLTPERSYVRKINEVVIASHLEHTVSKEHLLWLYVNLVYFGGAYGVEAASQSYFDKSAKDVSIAQAAFLAALIHQPEAYRLGGEAGKKKIMARQIRVIDLMVKQNMISWKAGEDAKAEMLQPQQYDGTCKRTHPYLNAAVNHEIGIKKNIPIASAGWNIRTSIDLAKQKTLDDGCREALAKYLKRHPANAETIRCAAIVVSIKSGDVIAMVSGQKFQEDQYDHVRQAQRQAGSTFKPFLYAALLEKIEGDILAERKEACTTQSDDTCLALLAEPIDLLSLCKVLDAPVWVPQVVGWKGRIVSRHVIKNYPYEGRSQHRGMILCNLGLGESRNTGTIWGEGQLAPADFGELDRWNYGAAKVVEMAGRLGIQSPLQHKSVTGKTDEERAQLLPNYTIAIGSAEVTLWEMAEAFLALVNGGCREEISFIKKATGADGKVLYEHVLPATCKRVLSPRVASAMRELMRMPIDVRGPRYVGGKDDVPLGTAASLRTSFPQGVLCGKTGTATGPDGKSSTENWFIGCTTEYLVAARINNINKTPLGKKETGGKNPLEVFRDFVLKERLLDPNAEFPPIDMTVFWQPPVQASPAR